MTDGGPLPPNDPRPEEGDLVFNIVWTGSTFSLLRPFTDSLAFHSSVRFRHVANACPATEVEAMRRHAEASDGRFVEALEISTSVMVRHGAALDRVLELRDDGELFCFVDPDILATGPWVPPLIASLSEHQAVTSGKELWADDNVRPTEHPGVNGEFFFDADGFTFGSPHLAIYRRAALQDTCSRWQIGFGSSGNDLPPEARQRLVDAGRGYWVYDTGKVVNILLQLDGRPLEHREVDTLLHVGGVSHFLAPPSTAPAAVGKPVRWGEGAEWTEDPRLQARHGLARYTAAAMHDLATGRPAPEPPPNADPALVPRYLAVRRALEGLQHHRVPD